MHGYFNGLPQLNNLLQNYDIICLREHWLHSFDFDKLLNLNETFSGICLSSMNNKIENGIRHGRPHGGSAILWRDTTHKKVSILHMDEIHGR